MASVSPTISLPAPISNLLSKLRLRIRGYVILQGLAVSTIWICLAFWIGLWIDWAFAPSWIARVVGMGVTGLGFAAILYRWILRRVFVSFSDSSMAILLEKRFRQFDDGLVTTVELAQDRQHHGEWSDHGFNVEMIRHAAQSTLEHVPNVNASSVFNIRRLSWQLAIGLALCVSVTAFAVENAHEFQFFMQRLTGSSETWPTNTLLTTETFSTQFAIELSAEDFQSNPTNEGRVYVFAGSVQLRPTQNGAAMSLIRQGNAIRFDLSDTALEAIQMIKRADFINPELARAVPTAASSKRGIATLHKSKETVWASESRRPDLGGRVDQGLLTLASGSCELLFDNGVTLTLNSGTKLRIVSSRKFELLAGRLFVSVPARLQSVEVKTPDAIIRSVRSDVLKVARGATVSILARVYARKHVPKDVEIRFRVQDGESGSEYMTRDGMADPELTEFQLYRHQFENIQSDIEFDLIGGDDRIERLRIAVSNPPHVKQILADTRRPDYLGGEFAAEQKFNSPAKLIRGTELVLRFTTSKPLQQIHYELLYSSTDKNRAPTRKSKSISLPDSDHFTINLGPITEDTQLMLTLLDVDRISTIKPVVYDIVAIPDAPPTVALRLRGIGSTITRHARLPIEGEIRDDHGLREAWYEVTISAGASSETTSATPVNKQTESKRKLKGTTANDRMIRRTFTRRIQPSGSGEKSVAINRKELFHADPLYNDVPGDDGEVEQLDLETLDVKLSPGQIIFFTTKASDHCKIDGHHNTGESREIRRLEVVTVEQLQVRLNSQKRRLREELLKILDSLEVARNTYFDLHFSATIAEVTVTDSFNITRSPRQRIDRAWQDTKTSASLTRSIAHSLATIREELINNRVDAEDDKHRIRDKMVRPLRNAAQQMDMNLLQATEQLQRHILLVERLAQDTATLAAEKTKPDSDPKLIEQLSKRIDTTQGLLATMSPHTDTAGACLETVDAIVAELRAVLDTMTDSEDVSQLADDLQRLIERHHQLNLQTIKKQKRINKQNLLEE